MEPIKHVICDVCGQIFESGNGTDICPNCLKKKEEQNDDGPDQSVLEPIIVDGDEDVDFDEDPDYDMDDELEDDEDPFELDLDEDLFDEDY